MAEKTILIIDDDPDDREIFCEIINEMYPKISCTTAIDGKEALEKLRGHNIARPDLIFLDLVMPVLNGADFLKTFKKDSLINKIPIIVYSTSKRSIRELKVAKDSGVKEFLLKPLRWYDLRKSISRIIDSVLRD